MRRTELWIAAIIALASVAGAAETKPAWKSHARKGLFRCELPADWKAKDLQAPDLGMFFSKDDLSIRAARYGKGSALRAPEDYLKLLPVAPQDLKRSKLAIAGRKAELFSFLYRRDLGGDDAPSHSEWVYEEVVLLPVPDGFWALSFQNSSSLPGDKPAGLEVWKRFLKSFRPG